MKQAITLLILLIVFNCKKDAISYSLNMEQTEHTISADGGSYFLPITTNCDYNLKKGILDNWVNFVPNKDSSIQNSLKTGILFLVERNIKRESRSAKFNINYGDGQSAYFTLNQSAASIKEKPEGDFVVPVSRAEADQTHIEAGSNYSIELSYDGDPKTFYHSPMMGKTKMPVNLTYFFNEIAYIDYIEVESAQRAQNIGRFKMVDIYAYTSEKPGGYKLMSYDFKGMDGVQQVNFPQKINKPTALRLEVKTAVPNASGLESVNLGEIRFYAKNHNNEADMNLFTDLSCSELKAGVSQTQIDNISNSLLKDIATKLLNGTYNKEFRVNTYSALKDPLSHSKITRNKRYSNLDNVTGIFAPAGEELIVYVTKIDPSTTLQLRCMDYPNGYSSQENYAIKEGINILPIRNGGLVYLMYHSDTPENLPPVTVHFATGKVNGYFNTEQHTPSDWTKLLNNSVYTYFDAQGKHSHLVATKKGLSDYTPNGTKLMEAYDKMVVWQQEFIGLYKYNKVNPNKMLFVYDVTAKSPNASEYRTVYSSGYLDVLCDINKFSGARVWGPAHEVGHMNQTQNNHFKWAGMTEVTNNLYGLHVQVSFGNPSRYIKEGKNDYINIYNMLMNSSLPYGAYANNRGDLYTSKLVPLWQLYLYFTQVTSENKDFYKDLHEHYRLNSNPKDGEALLNFVKLSCNISKLDLTNFFAAWGFLRPIDEKVSDYTPRQLTCTQEEIEIIKRSIASANYKKPEHNLAYLTDFNIEMYKNPATIVKGNISWEGNKVITSNWKNVAAFEVRNKETDKLLYVASSNINSDSFEVSESSSKVVIYAVPAKGEKIIVWNN